MTICNDLRQAVLQAAFQGKLTKQLPEDGNAADLLAEIKAEKENLMREKKIKKEKPFVPVSEDEIPFDIPENWEWVKLGNVLREVIVPMRDKPTFSKTGIPWCRIEDRDGFLLNGSKSNQLVSAETILNMNLKVLPVGTVLSACTGGSIGTIVINTVECCTNQTFNGLVCSSGLLNWYLFWYLKTQFNTLRSIGTGTTIAYVSQKKSKEMLIPLPPLAEQQRIVARVDELMAQIDEMEKTENELVALKKAFPGDMKASLLQAAMQGKLTKQLPEDGSAADLLAEIKVEKDALVRDKKVKREKPLELISEDEIPFDIPETWTFVPLKSIASVLYGFPFNSQFFSEEKRGVPLIRIRDVLPGQSKTFTTEPFDKVYIVRKGEMLVGMDGNFNVNFWGSEDAALNQRVCKITANRKYVLQKFLFYFLPLALDEISSAVSFCTVKHLSDKHLSKLLVPIPPLAEQQRIVEKLDKLLPLCDDLADAS